MYIREISLTEFKEFAENNEYANFRQTLSYAVLKAENDYEYEIIGYCDNDNNIYAAAVVLVKLIDGYLYAYIPSGFLADYTNEGLITEFTEALYKYYKKEAIVFIKINPSVPIADINPKNHNINYNDNYHIVRTLEKAGYNKIIEQNGFESVLPKVNALIDLDNFNINNLSKNTKNKIRKGIRKGLTIEKGTIDNINILKEFVKKKIKRSEYYYNDYFNIFSKENAVDYFLISIDYDKYIINSQDAYNKELKKNQFLNEKVINNPNDKNINTKMNSDKTLNAYKNDIAIASKNILENNKEYIAAALVIKYKNTATIIISGYDKKYKDFAPNYYLYYELCNYYQNEFKYLDLNGLTSDFSINNRYYGLNNFKLGFNPKVYEYIGEFDLIINNRVYNHLVKKGLLEKEFKNNSN